MSRQFKEPLVASGYDSESVTRKISDIVLKRPVTRGWLGGADSPLSCSCC
jgi:hypothetical protein